MATQITRWGLFRRYGRHLLCGIGCVIVALACRLGEVIPFSTQRVLIEHFFGMIGLGLAVFMPLSICFDRDVRTGTTRGSILPYVVSAALVLSMLCWEIGQGYATILTGEYSRKPRGYLQWEQIAVDLLATWVCFLLLRPSERR